MEGILISAHGGFSPRVQSELKLLFEGTYPIARDSVIFCEVVTGELNYIGMSQLRDAMDHIQRAFRSTDDEAAISDVRSAGEHLRRGATESLQRAAVVTMSKAARLSKVPSFLYKLALLPTPDRKTITTLLTIAKQSLFAGRSHKSSPSTWGVAISDFIEAMNTSQRIIDLCPQESDLRFRYITIPIALIAATLTAAGVVLGLVFLF